MYYRWRWIYIYIYIYTTNVVLLLIVTTITIYKMKRKIAFQGAEARVLHESKILGKKCSSTKNDLVNNIDMQF